MKKIIVAGILAMSVLMLPGCDLISSITDSLKGEPKQIDSADGLFTMEIPADWEQPAEGELNEVASLEAMKGADELYFMAIMESKEDFDLGLEEYRDLAVDYNEGNYGSSFGEPTKTDVNGNDAYSYEFYVTSPDGIKMYMRLFVVDTGNYYGQLYAWTLKSMESENKDVIDTIADTFQEK
jgi:hypothetical protein